MVQATALNNTDSTCEKAIPFQFSFNPYDYRDIALIQRECVFYTTRMLSNTSQMEASIAIVSC